MPELYITVSFPGMPEKTYRFDRFPVRVGRSEANDLAICHESVPRDLCTMWPEPDGRTVRVEERPGLKNPLLAGSTVVCGGVSREVVKLSVGPCGLTARTGEAPSRARRPGKGAAVSAVVVVAVIAIGVAARRTDTASVAFSAAALPKTPFCAEAPPTCASSGACAEQARMLVSRAREILSRPWLGRPERIRAAMTLETAAGMMGPEAANEADAWRSQAADLKTALTQQYQQDVMALARALRDGAPEAVRAAATPLLRDLGICGGGARDALEAMMLETGGKAP